MNNVFVYCEIEGTTVVDVSLELLSKGRKLANTLGVQLECICAGKGLDGIEKQVFPYGVDKVHVFDAEGLFPYTHSANDQLHRLPHRRAQNAVLSITLPYPQMRTKQRLCHLR